MTRYLEMKEHFEKFDKSHPEVWQLFEQLAFNMISRGFKNGSAQLIYERMRWEYVVERNMHDFKLNNNHRPFYVEKWNRLHPERNEFFKTRARTSKYEIASGLPPLRPEYFNG